MSAVAGAAREGGEVAAIGGTDDEAGAELAMGGGECPRSATAGVTVAVEEGAAAGCIGGASGLLSGGGGTGTRGTSVPLT